MLLDIPNPAEFNSVCINSLNLAWETVYDLLLQEEQADMQTWDDDHTVTDQYWESAQPALRNAISLIQHAHELGLKGKIAAVSPYILISQDPSRWPGVVSGGVSFTAFRTIDAVDLPKAVALFAAQSLSPEFTSLYEEVRVKRNIFSHGIAKSQRVTAMDTIRYILRSFHDLFPGERWTKYRLDHLLNNPTAIAFSTDRSHPRLILEMERVVDELAPSEAKLFFGVVMKSRWYICPGACFRELREDEFADRSAPLKQAQLTPPKTRGATKVHCFVCGETSDVKRTHCNSCAGDVLSQDGDVDVCLSCGLEQERP